MAVSDWSTTAGTNTSVGGVGIAEGVMRIPAINNAIRGLMAEMAVWFATPTYTGSPRPTTNDGFALGTATLSWSDLFLASGGVINWNNGDVTLTHSANTLAHGGASSGYTFDALVSPAANDGAALGTGTVSFSDLFLATGGVINFNNGDVTVTHSANTLTFGGAASGYAFTGGPVVPATNDASALGTSSLGWSDLFLATGGVINFAASDVVMTHSSGILTVGTGDLRVTTAGTNTASVVTVGGTQTLTNKTLTSPTLSTVTVSEATVSLSFNETDGPTDEKNWRILANGGNFNLQGQTDALGGAVSYITMSRTGTTLDQFTFAGTELQFDGTTLDINATTSDLSGTLNVAGQLTHADGSAGTPSLSFASDTNTGIYSNGADTIGFSTAGTVSAVLTNSILGVGATSAFSLTSGTTDGAYVEQAGRFVASISANSSLALRRRTSDGTIATFHRDTTNVGTISVTATNTAYNTSSDERLKENFRDFDAGEIIDRMTLYAYDWKGGGGNGYGPRAQELRGVLPGVVTPGSGEPGDEDFQPWGWQGDTLTALLLKEVQSLRSRLAALGG